jgi:DNA-binding GntR family transcriptional regulator
MCASRNETTKITIANALRRSIIMGHRRPGTRLNVPHLAKSYGSSVTPVRDALQMLSYEGLVAAKPRSGYYVTYLTLKELLDLLEMREILEVAAIERAASQITDEQLEQLERFHAGYSGDDDADIERYIDENRRVHCFIAEVSGNHKLTEMIGGLHDQMARFLALGHVPGWTRDYKHEHLIEALRTHDPVIARQALLNELKETRQTTIERVIQEEGIHWRVGARASE